MVIGNIWLIYEIRYHYITACIEITWWINKCMLCKNVYIKYNKFRYQIVCVGSNVDALKCFVDWDINLEKCTYYFLVTLTFILL